MTFAPLKSSVFNISTHMNNALDLKTLKLNGKEQEAF